MTNPYGPWATAIDAGRNPQLSAFWKQRLTMLVPTSQTSPVLSRRNTLFLVAAAFFLGVLPTFFAAPVIAEQQPAPPETHAPVAADRTSAAGLMRALYRSREWIDRARSFRIRADCKTTPSAEAVGREVQHPGLLTVSGKRDLRPWSEQVEWAWDESHIRYRQQGHHEGEKQSDQNMRIWDGSLAIDCEEQPDHKQYVLGNKAGQFFEPMIRNGLQVPWGPGDGYQLWWAPLDVARYREAFGIAPKDFTLAGQEDVQGKRCRVLQSRPGQLSYRFYLGVADGRLYRRDMLIALEDGAVRLAIYRKIAGPSIKTFKDWEAWLKDLKPDARDRAFRSLQEAEFKFARLCLRQTFDDYREVAPGCWLAFRQKSDAYETGVPQPFLDSRGELIVTDVALNQSLPKELFHLELAEGTAVATDWRYDPPISYKYRKDQTEAERVALCDAQRAKQAKSHKTP